MKLFVVGLSHKTAPVAVRERLAVWPARLRCYGCRLKLAAGLAEVVVVSTCNRVEVYGVAPRLARPAGQLFGLLAREDFDFSPYVYVKEGLEAVAHLFAVAGGLDSLVLGETEITGQVKLAYQAAQEAKLTGRVTNRLFQAALQTAKEIRTRTGIGRGCTSVGSVAVELAEKIFDGSLSHKTVMIIGAGKMGEACVRHLTKKGAPAVLVANRSFERAQELAGQIGGRALRFEERVAALAEADIVVSSTGAAQTILHREEIAPVLARRGSRPLFLIDIAVPRDIDPGAEALPNVYLYNVDHLEAIVRENVRQRQQELASCEAIIGQRAKALLAKLSLQAPPRPGTFSAPAPGWALGGVAACPV
jgi:glutamyl-tRNA reductase